LGNVSSYLIIILFLSAPGTVSFGGSNHRY